MEITKNETKEDISQYYKDVKKYLENYNILINTSQFEDKAYFRELQIRAMDILRHKLGFNFEDSKKLLERYIKDKKREVKKNIDQYE